MALALFSPQPPCVSGRRVLATTAAAASSFPGRMPTRPGRTSSSSKNNRDALWWMEDEDEPVGGDGGASSDDEGEEESSSDDEEWNRLSLEVVSNNNKLDKSKNMPNAATASKDESNTNALDKDSSSPSTTAKSDVSPVAATKNDSRKEGDEEVSKATSSSAGLFQETVKQSVTSEPTQPMQTLNKLQQMLDDTDYMTSNQNRKGSPHTTDSLELATEGALWTSKDRAKYRRVQNRERTPTPSSTQQPDGQSHSTKLPKPKQNEVRSQQKWPLPQQQQQQQKLIYETHQTVDTKMEQRHVQQQRQQIDNNQRPSPPIHQFSSDDENSEEVDDDGLGYTLPNLPVYYSDGEESDAASDDDFNRRYLGNMAQTVTQQHQGTTNHRPHSPTHVPSNHYDFPHQQQQQHGIPAPHSYVQQMPQQRHQPHPLPPYSFTTPHQHMYGLQQSYPQRLTPQQHAYYHQYPGAWDPYTQHHQGQHQLPPRAPIQLHPQTNPRGHTNGANTATTSQQSPPTTQPQHQSATLRKAPTSTTKTIKGASTSASSTAQQPLHSYSMDHTPPDIVAQEDADGLTFDSFQKIGLALVTVSLACYSGVSPRTLPLSQYNLRFYENLGLVSLATLVPIVQLLLLVSPRENDMNALINTFFTSFTLGYVLSFGSEIIATTVVRLIVFTWFEPKIFSLAPKVPVPVIPWVLRETGYRPKRITLLAAEIAASCIVCPIIEEYMKLAVMQWTTNLKRNFMWTKKYASNKRGRLRKKLVGEAILRPPNEPDIVSANQYVSQMLAASLGLKLCDAGRRILLYTKRSNPSRSFYAFCRGLFPIQELCGTMTAIGLAKKNLLGVKMPLWKMLAPAVLIHGMANFRGKKPVYRWGSTTPWSEMQLPAFHILDSSSLPKLLSKGFAKLMWLIIIARVAGYCIKNYYMVNRQAVKRTTTYAGKPAAFSAELTTTEMLKKK